MPPTILHVEDDAALSEIVQLSFEGFGFRGTFLTAETVADAESILGDVARNGGFIDLIISDMNLPDGSGLEVVRDVRKHPAWEKTPILILSGDADPKKVGRAYALGANAYIAKAPPTRSSGAVVKTLYEHWLRDVVLPAARPCSRTRQFLSKAIKVRARYAAFYMRMADQFGESPSEVAFWLSRALNEANLTNLLTFLLQQLEDELPAEILDEVEQAQAEAERTLTAIERDIEAHPITTRDEAYRRMLQLVANFQVQAFARTISYWFPVAPVAIGALRDFVADYLDEISGWVDIHARHLALRGQSATLRTGAAYLRSLR